MGFAVPRVWQYYERCTVALLTECVIQFKEFIMIGAFLAALGRGAGMAATAAGEGLSKSLQASVGAVQEAGQATAKAFNGVVNYGGEQVKVVDGSAMHGGKTYRTDGKFVFEQGKLVGQVGKGGEVSEADGNTLHELLQPSTPNHEIAGALRKVQAPKEAEGASSSGGIDRSLKEAEQAGRERDMQARQQKEMQDKLDRMSRGGGTDYVNAGLASFHDLPANQIMSDLLFPPIQQ
jgi:hypothetical protein